MVSAPLALPRLVLAAPTSGAGKTTVTTGLMAALRARGLRVSPHKVGPDYIDPGYHALATGRPGRNLDAVLCGPARLAPLFAHGARGADVAVVEGVMGLFDGVARPQPGEAADHASTAHVARLLDAPVILVVDVSGAARSIAALVAGFRSFDRRIHLAGVILNRVGSPRHRELLTEALGGIGVAVFGAVPREQSVHTPSRHLGLVPAAERRPAALDAVDRLGALVAASCDLDGLLRVARAAPPLRTEAWDPAAALATVGGTAAGRPPRIAVAGGAAFTFGYAEHVELLTAAGADVVAVDPLRDDTLPAGTDALIIGGGFPEEHVGALTANTRLRGEIAAFAARGAPVAAECAGLLYLARSLDGAPMCAVLDVAAVMGPRLTLGYRRAVAATPSPLAPAGSVLAAHEFHRTVLLAPPAGGPPAAWWLPVVDPAPTAPAGAPLPAALPGAPPPTAGLIAAPSRRPAEAPSRWLAEGFVHRRVHASYLHLHWAGRPQIATGLIAAARAYRRDNAADTRHPDPPSHPGIPDTHGSHGIPGIPGSDGRRPGAA
ncbi:cobyrinate a,c-diamide synthase [Frankia sp. ACN1ag]|uniref:cobyrinate a,c-diamide synthase n=1 Tax=Frankia sp. ACN1ag TaxID=102891 RepID=UPI0009F9ABDE|nr:cobyrinate a,c-diamide synthase [Frankia sp. ACN1ag]